MAQQVEKDPKKYHSKRRIFAIINKKIEIAPKNCILHHDEWFIKNNWIKSKEDPLYEKITRGMIDPKGDLYFYTGKDLNLTKKSEEEFFRNLKELVVKLKIPKETKIKGGMVRGEIGVQWPERKFYGLVGDF